MQIELIHQAELQRLVHDAGAAHEVYVLVTSGRLCLRDRGLDVGDKGEGGCAGDPDLMLRSVRRDRVISTMPIWASW